MKSPLCAVAVLCVLSTWACQGGPSETASSKSTGKAKAAEAPKPPPIEPPPSDVPDKVEGANLSIQRMSFDGLDVENMSCKLAEMPLMASTVVLGQLARSKGALDACVDKASKPRFAWSSSKGTISGIAVAGAPSPEAAVCLEEAIKAAKISLDVECVATFILGGP